MCPSTCRTVTPNLTNIVSTADASGRRELARRSQPLQVRHTRGKTDRYEGSRSKQNGKNVIKCGPGKVEDHLAMAVTGQVYEHEDAG